MKVENGTLVIDEPLSDETVETLLASLNEASSVVVRERDLGGAVIQALLCARQHKPVAIETDSEMLRQVFANPVWL